MNDRGYKIYADMFMIICHVASRHFISIQIDLFLEANVLAIWFSLCRFVRPTDLQ